MNPFEQLLEDLGKLLQISLHAEQGFLCKLNMKGLSIQLEYDETKQTLFMVSFLPQAAVGLFSENLFLEALKDNATNDPFGVFGYAEGTGSLALQLLVPISTSADKVFDLLGHFKEKSLLWKEAIEQNTLSPIQKPVAKNAPSPLSFMR